MIMCGQRKSQIKGALIHHSYDSLAKHRKARRCAALILSKRAGNIWQLSNLFMSLHDLMLLSVTFLDVLLLSHRSNKTWRKPNVSQTCPKHWQLIRRSLVGRHNLDSGKPHLVSEKPFSVVHSNRLHKQFWGSRYNAKSKTIHCNIHKRASIS